VKRSQTNTTMNHPTEQPPELTAERLEELKRLYAKASPGPWEYYELDYKGAVDGIGYIRNDDEKGREIHHVGDMQRAPEENRANGKLTAEMFNAFPSLLHSASQLHSLRSELAVSISSGEYNRRHIATITAESDSLRSELQEANRCVRKGTEQLVELRAELATATAKEWGLGEALSWALDLLDMYDKRLVDLGEPEDRVYSPIHLDGKKRARRALSHSTKAEGEGQPHKIMSLDKYNKVQCRSCYGTGVRQRSGSDQACSFCNGAGYTLEVSSSTYQTAESEIAKLHSTIASLQSRLEAAEGALRTAVDSANHFGSEFERLAMGLGLEYTAPEMVTYLLQHDEDVRAKLTSTESRAQQAEEMAGRVVEALKNLLFAHECADETGYVDDVGFLDVESITKTAHELTDGVSTSPPSDRTV
jgi:hypothetical protein